jgi:two-component system cell cycle response regulator CtrA
MTRVLLIEDDDKVSASVGLLLKAEGIDYDVVRTGSEGVDFLRLYKNCYDLVILDLMLPDIDGYEVLLRLRSAKIRVPVLILSGLSDTEHKIKGLNCGADDYLSKPFNRGELVARIQAVVRRSNGHSESVVKFDKVSINLDTRAVEVDGKPVHLTNKEYAILELLAMRNGAVLTKEMFLNHLYNTADEPEIKIIDVFVCKLRKKLADASGGTNYIETVWGRGYMLKKYEHDETNAKEEKNVMTSELIF